MEAQMIILSELLESTARPLGPTPEQLEVAQHLADRWIAFYRDLLNALNAYTAVHTSSTDARMIGDARKAASDFERRINQILPIFERRS
jgi:hypothetical protein